VGSQANVAYSRRLAEKVVVADVDDNETAFEEAFDLINAALDRPAADGRRTTRGEVWANSSARPRTVSFAVATAALSIMADRDRIPPTPSRRSSSRRNSPRSAAHTARKPRPRTDYPNPSETMRVGGTPSRSAAVTRL
jgi:hypothetical protein